jgi:predicted RNA methylase
VVPMAKWTYRDLEVRYLEHLDGCGTEMAVPFVTFVKNRYPGKKFGKIFEWCSGPGFIGFALLREGLCERLCLADINPEAIECVAETVKQNGLQDRVSYYLSDNLDDVPHSEVFDLVVANPPNYYAINPEHPEFEAMKNDLRPNDPGWTIHRRFYAQIAAHLAPGGLLLISEIEPSFTRVHIKPDEVAWDIRPTPPIGDFKTMIANGGLTYLHTAPYLYDGAILCCLVISSKPDAGRLA